MYLINLQADGWGRLRGSLQTCVTTPSSNEKKEHIIKKEKKREIKSREYKRGARACMQLQTYCQPEGYRKYTKGQPPGVALSATVKMMATTASVTQ